MSRFTTLKNLLDAVVASTTGNGEDVSQRKKMSVQFTAADIVAGNGVFTIEVSNDNVNWITYNRLTDNLANNNSQTDTRVASVTLNSNTSKIYFFAPGDHFRMVRAKVVRTTDGTYTATLAAVD